MSEPSRYCCGRRRLAVSAVAFLLPQQQHQLSVHRFLPPTTCSVNPHPSPSSTSTTFGGIQIAPQPPPAAAARSTRRHRHYYGSSGSNSALFAAVVASSEEKERGAGVDKSPNLEEPEEKVGRAKTEQLLPGGYPLGRTAELGRPRRRQRLRSVAVGRTLGRVFGRGRSEEEEQDDDDTKFNSVVAERTEQQVRLCYTPFMIRKTLCASTAVCCSHVGFSSRTRKHCSSVCVLVLGCNLFLILFRGQQIIMSVSLDVSTCKSLSFRDTRRNCCVRCKIERS